MEELKKLCYIWLEKEFERGLHCNRFSTDASEFHKPMIYNIDAPQMVEEIMELINSI